MTVFSPAAHDTDGRYTLNGCCGNCGHREQIVYAKGYQAHSVLCPRCGCKTLRPVVKWYSE